MADLNKIIEDLSSLTVVEAAELSKQLEEKWGVTAATAVAAAPVAGVKNVATLPTLDEARAKIVGVLRSPAQKIASILLAPASKIAILALEKSKK